MTTVYGFDRDHTVDVNPHPHREAVPLEWVIELRDRTHTEVWAIGNQRLKGEAAIPGVAEARERLEAAIAADRVEDTGALDGAGVVPRRDRLRLLEGLFPDAEGYVVVDDVDLSDMDAWTHYFPWEFYREFRDEFEG